MTQDDEARDIQDDPVPALPTSPIGSPPALASEPEAQTAPEPELPRQHEDVAPQPAPPLVPVANNSVERPLLPPPSREDSPRTYADSGDSSGTNKTRPLTGDSGAGSSTKDASQAQEKPRVGRRLEKLINGAFASSF